MKVWKDVRATVITAAVLLLAFSVVFGWNWPLLGDNVRAGIAILAVGGLAVCGTSGWAASEFSWRNPFIVTGVVAGAALLAVGVIGFVTNAMSYLVAMVMLTILLWLVATTRHLVEAMPRGGPAPTT